MTLVNITDTTNHNIVLNTGETIRVLMLEFINNKDVKPSSRSTYHRAIKRFAVWLEEAQKQFNSLTRVDIIEYKNDLLCSPLSALTAASYLTTVRQFYEWLESEKRYPNIARGVKSPKRKQKFKKQSLFPEQISEMLDRTKDISFRDFAIINLMVRTGLRTIEVSRANVEDITFIHGQRVLMVQGKGSNEKDDFVLLSRKSYDPLHEYFDGRQEGPLFISTSNNNFGKRLTTRTISYVAKQALKRIGLDDKKYSAHSLRHSTATNILRAGGSIEKAQNTLRHASSVTTQIYTETIKDELRIKDSGELLLDELF